MSYCRELDDESDVYVFATTGGLQCYSGWRHDFFTPLREKMIEHLLEHRKAGDKVPERALVSLREEVKDG